MKMLTRSLICFWCLLIFSSAAPQTFWFEIDGSIIFSDKTKGSTEGLIVQLYADGNLVSESEVDKDLHFHLEFLDLNFERLKLYYHEPGCNPFFIIEVDWKLFYDQTAKLDLVI